MVYRPDRRSLLIGAAFGLGALATGGAASALELMMAKGFTHNVASGEPGPDTVLLWTRYVPSAGDDARLTVEVSKTTDFTRVVAGGTATASQANDFTTRLTVTGLELGQWYFYRFIAADGTKSPTGRTKTLPAGPTARFGMAIFSCSNLPYGWFNAYGHAAARDDIDVMVHVGDYIYEYQRGYYPGADQAVKDRIIEPDHELLRLADYRLRYASYRCDPDLQKLHQFFPMIAQWDDHETANDAWAHGAQNHQPDEGDYDARKAAAVKAYNEWLPVGGKTWSKFEIGDLATLFRPETRLTARSERLDYADIMGHSDNVARDLLTLHDKTLIDPARTLMGSEQEAWLYDGFAQSVRSGTKWQILAQEVVMGNMISPHLPPSLLSDPRLSPQVSAYLKGTNAAAQLGLPVGLDNWGGFPAHRARLLKAAQSADADLVVLSGDSHNAWAFDLGQDGKPAGVEFAGHSVTSPGYEEALPLPPQAVANILIGSSPELKWAETSRRGYMALDLTPERVTGEWVFLDTIAGRSTATVPSRKMQVERGRRVFTA